MIDVNARKSATLVGATQRAYQGYNSSAEDMVCGAKGKSRVEGQGIGVAVSAMRSRATLTLFLRVEGQSAGWRGRRRRLLVARIAQKDESEVLDCVCRPREEVVAQDERAWHRLRNQT